MSVDTKSEILPLVECDYNFSAIGEGVYKANQITKESLPGPKLTLMHNIDDKHVKWVQSEAPKLLSKDVLNTVSQLKQASYMKDS